MGIAKYLKIGRIIINKSEKQIEIDNKSFILPYDKLRDSDWGYIYEKYVGQILEDEGYSVQYNGLESGWIDRGIDLIAMKDGNIKFIQCKFTKGIISKNKIEWILYKASQKLYEDYKQYHNKICFMLIVNRKDINFSRKIPKNFQLNFSEISKVEYPILQYYLDHNHVQDKVRLGFREIEMIK